MIFEVSIENLHKRMEAVKMKKGEWRHKWFSDERKYVLYLTDIDQTILKATVMKTEFADVIAERNFKNTFLDTGMQILKEI